MSTPMSPRSSSAGRDLGTSTSSVAKPPSHRPVPGTSYPPALPSAVATGWSSSGAAEPTTAVAATKSRLAIHVVTRGSIAVQLLLFATLLASLTTAVVGTLSYVRARRALEREAQHRLTVLARDMGERLHRELADRVADITNWTGLKLMRAMLYRDVDKELALFLRQAIGTPPLYAGVACVGADGTVVASAGETAAAGDGLLRLQAPIPHPDQPGVQIGTVVAWLDRRRLLDTLKASAAPGAWPSSIVLSTAKGEVVLADERGNADPGTAMLSGAAAVERVPGADLPPLAIRVAEPVRSALADVFALRATLLT